MFKLLAIRPLEGCAQHIQKCLKTDMMYYFCNDYIIEPGSYIRRRSKNIKPLKEDFFSLPDTTDDVRADGTKTKSPTVSVSAIVGKNGDGKSTLVELMMRLINNCAISYKLCASPNDLRRVKNVKAELYYMVDNVVYRMAEENYNDGTRIWKIADLNTSKQEEESMRWDIAFKEIKNVKEAPECFFFTIVSNYSHYAYNVFDYEKEWEVHGDEKDDDEKCWLHNISHDNDGYLTPITLHPYRYNGNIDINVEKELSKQRLLSLFLNADNPKEKGHSFRRVNGKDANVLKLTEEVDSKLQQKVIIDINKTTGKENNLDLFLNEIDKVEQQIDKTTSLIGLDDSFIKDFEMLVDFMQLNFINPISKIINQYEFKSFVNEIVNWLETAEKRFVDNTGSIGDVISHYTSLNGKLNRYVETMIYCNNGMEYDRKGKVEKSIKEYEMAIDLTPNCIEAYNNRGIAYYNKSQYDMAIEDYDNAIKLSSQYAEIYNNRGNAFTKMNEYSRAIRDYDEALKLNPQYAEAYYNRGNAHYSRGDYTSAILDYNMAIKLNQKDAESYFARGNAYFYLGLKCEGKSSYYDYDPIKEYENENYRKLLKKRIEGYRKDTQFDVSMAIRDYDDAIKLFPSYQEAYFNRGNAYLKKGNAYFQDGSYYYAIRNYDKALELNPKCTEAYFNRGNAYYYIGDYDTAILDYNKVISLNSKETNAFYNRGNAYFKKGEYHSAIRNYNRAIIPNSTDADVYYNLGNAYYKNKKYDDAIKNYHQATILNPKDVDVYYNAGNACFMNKKYDDAIKYYDMAITLNPKDANAFFNRGLAKYKMENYEAATSDYNEYKNRLRDIEEVQSFDNKKDCLECKNNKELRESTSIIKIQMQYKQRNDYLGNTDMSRILQFQKKNKIIVQNTVLLSVESEKTCSINITQLGKLDTLYRIMKAYDIDWRIVPKKYSNLSIKEKCQHYIVYEAWSIISKCSQYKKAYQKDNIKSFRECGSALEDCIEEIKNDSQSHITRELRQTEHFIQEYDKEGNIYELVGKKVKKNILVNIDELRKHYSGEVLSLDNLPPPIYKWDILFNIKEDPAHCDIGLDSFSSGEKQKLNSIGAIVYHLQNLAHTASEVKYNNVNLIMEEIELYYHPEYQRQFFNELLIRIKGADLLNIQNINIEFVTHSPFILSDIPKSNVLFLKEGMPDDELQENTFGANIHSLLKHGFFMPNLPIGEFAYVKINDLFKKLNSGDFTNDDEEKRKKELNDIYQQILLVGEPFLRNQLLLLYNSFKGSK